MNPYDFVPIDWQNPPKRRTPVWHHRLVGDDNQTLYSGHIEVDVVTETPIFIFDPYTKDDAHDPDYPATSLKNAQGNYIIPGSSLKGMLRCLVETLGNGCLTLFDATYEPRTVWLPPKYPGGRQQRVTEYDVHYENKIEDDFWRCNNHTNLCIACRTFGMLSQKEDSKPSKEKSEKPSDEKDKTPSQKKNENSFREKGEGVFLGKVNIGDAVGSSVRDYEFGSIYTPVLSGPKPRHAAFYLEQVGNRQYIAGRKYYFHHIYPDMKLPSERELRPSSRGEYMNQHIRPIDYDSWFHFRIEFTNLEADEFAALMLAITLQPDMRHKIGYGKPIGLGSIQIIPTELVLVDYTKRYIQGNLKHGFSIWKGEDELQPLFDARMQAISEEVRNFIQQYLAQNAMKELQRIWQWEPEKGIEYFYPDKRRWFDIPANKGKRIRDTRTIRR